MAYSNRNDLPLPLAIFLAADAYDHNEDVVSVTKFIKPLRELILAERVTGKQLIQREADVLDQLQSRLGTATHAHMENVLKDDKLRNAALEALGIPQKTRDKIVVNPADLKAGQIPLLSEYTGYKEHQGFVFRGTADIIFNGRLADIKQTTTYSHVDANKDKKYGMQGSMYRWIMPKLITENIMDIYEIYINWERFKALQQAAYPQNRIHVKNIPLMEPRETERYVNGKVKLIDDLYNAKDEDIPECTDEELWRSPSVFKYYKDPNKTERSNGNFDNYADALAKKHANNDVGIIKEVKSTVRACLYCDAFPVCEQAKRLQQAGEIAT